MILDLNNIKDVVTKEGLEVLVVSYGGSASNTLVNQLQKEGYICRTVSWCNLLCHCPKYVDIDIPIIYIYDNIIKSFLSMKNRGIGIWDVNQRKLSNNLNEVLSDENLIKLENLLKRNMNHFPILYKSPKTHNENINKYIHDKIELFNKYKLEIEMINNFTN